MPGRKNVHEARCPLHLALPGTGQLNVNVPRHEAGNVIPRQGIRQLLQDLFPIRVWQVEGHQARVFPLLSHRDLQCMRPDHFPVRHDVHANRYQYSDPSAPPDCRRGEQPGCRE